MAPNSTGSYKVGGNYGPTIISQANAHKRGHSQNLWLWDRNILEVGASNAFFAFKDKSGLIEMVTPSLEDGLVLPGVTRDSLIEFFHHDKDFIVTERKISID